MGSMRVPASTHNGWDGETEWKVMRTRLNKVREVNCCINSSSPRRKTRHGISYFLIITASFYRHACSTICAGFNDEHSHHRAFASRLNDLL
jgi:hypothetical protein